MAEQDRALAGWIVKVITNAPGEPEPNETWYAVGRTAKLDAALTARQHPDLEAATVDARRPLSALEVERLNLKTGEVRRYS